MREGSVDIILLDYDLFLVIIIIIITVFLQQIINKILKVISFNSSGFVGRGGNNFLQEWSEKIVGISSMCAK